MRVFFPVSHPQDERWRIKEEKKGESDAIRVMKDANLVYLFEHTIRIHT
jgi:hypothetical protein